MLEFKNLPVSKQRGNRLSALEVNQIVDALKIALKGELGPTGISSAGSAVTAQWAWASNVGETGIDPFRPVGIVNLAMGEEDSTDKLTTEIVLEVINPEESVINFEGHYAIAAQHIPSGQIGRVWTSGICPAWGLSVDDSASEDGVMASYTSGSEITVLVSSGHDLEDDDTVTVSWSEGGVSKSRIGVVVDMTDNTATLVGGSGDLYPDSVGLSMNIFRPAIEKTYGELLHQEDDEGAPALGKDYLTCISGGSSRIIWKKEDSDDEQLIMVRLGFASILISPAEIVPVKVVTKVNYNTYLGAEYENGTDVGPTANGITIKVLQIHDAATIPTAGSSTFFPAWLQKWGGVLYRTIDVARDY